MRQQINMYYRKEQDKIQEEQLSEVEIVKRIQINDNEYQRSQKKNGGWDLRKRLRGYKKCTPKS